MLFHRLSQMVLSYRQIRREEEKKVATITAN